MTAVQLIDGYYGSLAGARVKAFPHAGGILVFGEQGREFRVVADLRGTPIIRKDLHPNKSYALESDPLNTTVVFAGGCGCSSPLKYVTERDAIAYLEEHPA